MPNKKEEFINFVRNKPEVNAIPFGKFKDVPLEEVPTWYLDWFLGEGRGTKELYTKIETIYWGRVQGIIPRPSADYEEREIR